MSLSLCCCPSAFPHDQGTNLLYRARRIHPANSCTMPAWPLRTRMISCGVGVTDTHSLALQIRVCHPDDACSVIERVSVLQMVWPLRNVSRVVPPSALFFACLPRPPSPSMPECKICQEPRDFECKTGRTYHRSPSFEVTLFIALKDAPDAERDVWSVVFGRRKPEHTTTMLVLSRRGRDNPSIQCPLADHFSTAS